MKTNSCVRDRAEICQNHARVAEVGLGKDAKGRVGRLSPNLRQSILREVAMYGGMNGLDFAADVAKTDPSPEVQAKVVEALAFRWADRQVAEVLRKAGDKTFDLLTHQTRLDHIEDECVRRGLAAAGGRERTKGSSPGRRLSTLVSDRGGRDHSAEVRRIIAEMEIGTMDRRAESLIDLAREQFPRAVAEGMLQRVRKGRSLPYQATEYMAAGRFSIEDGCLPDCCIKRVALCSDSDANVQSGAHVVEQSMVSTSLLRFLPSSACGLSSPTVNLSRTHPWLGDLLFYRTNACSGRKAMQLASLLNIALECNSPSNARADAAASVLGPECVGRLIDRMVELEQQTRNAEKGPAKEARDHHTAIRNHLYFAQLGHFLAAIESRAREASNETIEEFANLIGGYRHRDDLHGRKSDDAARAKIADFVKGWGERLLSSGNATRRELASIATMAQHAPSGDLLPILERLLDEELRLLRGFQKQAQQERDPEGEAWQEFRIRWDFHYEAAFSGICCPEATTLMHKYLMDEEFGCSAARLLATRWRRCNELEEEKGWLRPPIFSRVAEQRATRDAKPEATSDEAEAIFGAVEQLMGAGSTDAHKRHAVILAVIACALPHGERKETIDRLIANAAPERKLALLTNLVFAGEVIDLELVRREIATIHEHARKTGHWVDSEGRTLQRWVRLLPFTTDPSETIEIVQTLPEEQRTPYALGELLTALAHAPGDDFEEVIFGLAEVDPRLYVNREWVEVAFGRESRSSATRLLDLASEGAFNGEGNTSDRDIYTRLASLIGEFPDLRMHLYKLLETAIGGPGMRILEQTIGENPDEEGVMRLMQLEIERKDASTAWRAIERVLTHHEPIEGSSGSYHVFPVAANEVRRKLLARTKDGGPDDIAAQYLNAIDEFRDQFGSSESEPRHPDLGSRKAWPIVPNRKDSPNSA